MCIYIYKHKICQGNKGESCGAVCVYSCTQCGYTYYSTRMWTTPGVSSCLLSFWRRSLFG